MAARNPVPLPLVQLGRTSARANLDPSQGTATRMHPEYSNFLAHIQVDVALVTAARVRAYLRGRLTCSIARPRLFGELLTEAR